MKKDQSDKVLYPGFPPPKKGSESEHERPKQDRKTPDPKPYEESIDVPNEPDGVKASCPIIQPERVVFRESVPLDGTLLAGPSFTWGRRYEPETPGIKLSVGWRDEDEGRGVAVEIFGPTPERPAGHYQVRPAQA